MSSMYKSTTYWSGNTYPIRAEIKALGGRWDKDRQCWVVPGLSMRERSGVYSRCRGLRGVEVSTVDPRPAPAPANAAIRPANVPTVGPAADET